jgi:hypothetical protein
MILLPSLAGTFAAFCVWLVVRITNRRERWAKWMLAVVFSVPVLYVASFGPACWATAERNDSNEWNPVMLAYWPIGCVRWYSYSGPIVEFLDWWANLGVDSGFTVSVPAHPSGTPVFGWQN